MTTNLHPDLPPETFNHMVATALSHAQLQPAPQTTWIGKQRAWFDKHTTQKALGFVFASLCMVVLSLSFMSNSQHMAGDESFELISSIISYDTIDQLAD